MCGGVHVCTVCVCVHAYMCVCVSVYVYVSMHACVYVFVCAVTAAVLFHSDVQNGLVGSAFAVSIVAFILATAVTWVHIYRNRSKNLHKQFSKFETALGNLLQLCINHVLYSA